MESEIFSCIDDDDVERLKSLMHYPNLFEIEDNLGRTILQRAIFSKSFEVFNFLLSLDDCPLNARSSDGTTAMEFTLNCCHDYDYGRVGEKFIYLLLKKGADIDWRNYQDSPAFNLELYDDDPEVVQCLIEKGLDLNYQDSDTGRTPLHQIHNLYPNQNEFLAMMLYFGGDPLIPDFNGYTPIDYAFSYRYLSESMLEDLVFYVFDDYCPGYDIPIDSLFGLLQLESPLVPQILKHISSVNLDIADYTSQAVQNLLKKIFVVKPEYLKLLLEKFDYIIEAVLDAFFECNHIYLEEISIDNCDLLLQSRFNSDLIQIINEIPISDYLEILESANKPHSEIINLILFMLSYGARIEDGDLDLIYQEFGDCEFFRMLLHMNHINIIIDKFRGYDIMPALLYNIHMDMETFLSGRYKKYGYSRHTLDQLLSYFAHPKLQNFARSCPMELKKVHAKLNELPEVPLLVELARNKVRKFLIQKYKIKNSMQFYTLIKHLPISKVHQKIINLETKLY